MPFFMIKDFLFYQSDIFIGTTNGSEMPSSRSNLESVEVEARDLSNSGSLRDIQIACICGVDEEWDYFRHTE